MFYRMKKPVKSKDLNLIQYAVATIDFVKSLTPPEEVFGYNNDWSAELRDGVLKYYQDLMKAKTGFGDVNYINRKAYLPLRIFRRGQYRCAICRLKAEYFVLGGPAEHPAKTFRLFGVHRRQPILFTKDHIVPASHGGATRFANLACMCSRCNAIKGDLLSGHIRQQLESVAADEKEKNDVEGLLSLIRRSLATKEDAFAGEEL
jgi:hypothetical protein